MQLSTGGAGASQAAEYHFCEDIRGHVTTTPFGVEIFGWRSGDHFIHGLSRRDQNLDALPNLHQYVAVLLQICACGYWPMAWDDLCLPVSLRQKSIERMDHAID
jgi:hypothetical protein